MNSRNVVVAIIMSIGLMVLIFELVRRRKLNEEYSWLWMLTGTVIFLLTVIPGILRRISNIIGATNESATLFFFGVIFLVFICLHFSVKISELSNRLKELTQKIALLEKDKGEK